MPFLDFSENKLKRVGFVASREGLMSPASWQKEGWAGALWRPPSFPVWWPHVPRFCLQVTQMVHQDEVQEKDKTRVSGPIPRVVMEAFSRRVT